MNNFKKNILLKKDKKFGGYDGGLGGGQGYDGGKSDNSYKPYKYNY